MTLRKRLPALALAVALFGLFPAAPALTFQGKPAPAVLRLGSWNIENLGSPGSRRGPGQGKLQDPRDLAKYIRYARVDLLALQEITADAPAPPGFPRKYRTSSVLTKTFNELN